MREVAVTGIGIVSALGNNTAAFWDALAAGRPGIEPIRSLNMENFRFRNGAEVRGFDPLSFFEPKAASTLDRSAQFAGAAAIEALAQSQLPIVGNRTAVVTGSSGGGKLTEDAAYEQMYAHGRQRFEPLTIPRVMMNGSASWISMHHGVTGPAYTVSTACASAAHAIGQAFWMVRGGLVDAAIAGGTDAPFAPGFLRAWEAMRVVSPGTCSPFSKGRQGLILGEGAGILILESLESARARGAKIYARITGFGMSSDASHLTMPSPLGAASAMRAALADASLKPEQIGYINAHGTGTEANDKTETQAIRLVFPQPPAVSSTKSMHGHALGASPALEAAATVLALHHGVLPPTANFTNSDPECDLDIIPGSARPATAENAISNSFAFGGLNACLVFSRSQ